MDCGVPFCHEGCPLGNLIPDWNDLVYRGKWREAIDQLHATNNFPEFTGLICPAPCESACVLDINDDPVTIEQIELAIIERALGRGLGRARAARRAHRQDGRRVGSGPAGLAVAAELNKRGHGVTVYERDEGVGRPDALRRARRQAREVDHRPPRRACSRRRASTSSATSTSAATSRADELRERHDAVVIAIGSRVHRDLDGPRPRARRRALRDGLPLPAQPRGGRAWRAARARDARARSITAAGKRVVVVGGGDTGMDCISNAIREGATRRAMLDVYPELPDVGPRRAHAVAASRPSARRPPTRWTRAASAAGARR